MQGLHQVAKKLTMNGLPLLLMVAVLTVLPLMSLRLIEGSWAEALNAMQAITVTINVTSTLRIGFRVRQVNVYTGANLKKKIQTVTQS